MSAHVIRLRGFWKRDELPDGRIRFSRPFGRPRTLDEGETVRLTCSRSPGDGSVLVNDRAVGTIRAGEPFAFDVTAQLFPRNVVGIELVNGVDWPGEMDLVIAGSESE